MNKLNTHKHKINITTLCIYQKYNTFYLIENKY